MNPAPRPRPIRLVGYLLVDLFGFLCLALAVAWFAGGKGVILDSFPGSTAEAVASAGGGLVLIVWAIGRVLRELGRQAPPRPAGD
ncbi:hypothetical protein [Azonexus sp.]|uniref:hypothetical protein n=1 Tax=Azonexus sp. TaxID=1872668 RepID=UPI0035AD7B25